jgi:hypothetical protein
MKARGTVATVDRAFGLFTLTDVTNSQFLFITSDVEFFRLELCHQRGIIGQ